MERKFTPGPWKIAGRGERKIGIDVPDQGTVCHHIDVWHSSYGWPTHEQAEANARLIIASPDLLEACIQARSVLVTARADYHNNDTAKSVLTSRIETLTKVITKALGGN